MLEKMNEFFDKRLDEYEDHQLNCIEIKCLLSAGFSSVEILNHWGETYTIKAIR